MRRLIRATVAVLSLAACTTIDAPLDPTHPSGGSPSLLISDAAHGNGTPGFYFLPPMVPSPGASGVFDADIAGLAPTVVICQEGATDCGGSGPAPLMVFTPGTTPAVVLGLTHYQVNWKTRGLAVGTYRIHVLAGAEGSQQELGAADVMLCSSAQAAKVATTTEQIGVKIGSTLPIKFRIETGIVGALLAVTPANATIDIATTQLYTATVRDLHGAVLSGRTVTWGYASVPGAATVAGLSPTTSITDASGQATTILTAGQRQGTVTVTATSEGRSGQAGLTVRSPLFVSNRNNNSITIYAPGASGNAPPIGTIIGPSTGMDYPFGLARDVAGNLYVANVSINSITVYAPGTTGNAAPIVTLAGVGTGLCSPRGLALDDAGKLYVANQCNSITVYAPGATGNAPPTITISGANTGLDQPHGIARDDTGRLYVANYGSNSITVYAPGAAGNAVPVATIVGTNTGLQGPHGMVLDAAMRLIVANPAAAGQPPFNSVTVYSAGATGNVIPGITIQGAGTGLSYPTGVAVDVMGNLYVINRLANSITVYAPGASGNATPIATIMGGSTGLSQPFALTF